MSHHDSFWERKSLIMDFAITDLKIRYRSSLLGVLWSFLEPLLMLAILYVVFTNVFQSQIHLFPLYLLLGLICWNMFVRGTSLGLTSISSRSGILSHIYIPGEIPPISAAVTSLMMLTIEMIIFSLFLMFFQFVPSNTIIILPLVFILEFLLVIGFSLALSVLSIKFKDVHFIWGIILHAGFFVTPIFYNIDVLPKNIQPILVLNPMTQILNIARDVALYNTLPTIEDIVIATIGTLIIFGSGYYIFRRLSSRIIEEL